MLQIPLSPVPAQTLTTVLANQGCQIKVYMIGARLDFDLTVDGAPIVTTRVCRNICRILLDARYHGFVGDFCFVDTQGDTDPYYTGLGSRFQLVYLEATDLPNG